MQFFTTMTEYYDHLARTDRPEDDIEYVAMKRDIDAVAVFDMFVRRNVAEARQAQFVDGSNDEADLVRRAIRAAR